MELTPEKIRQIMNLLMLKAKEIRAEIPYSKTDTFAQSVVFLGPNLEPVSMPINWSTEREKYAKMDAVSKTASETFCQAVAMIADVRWVQEETAVKILGIPSREEVGFETFAKNYKRVITERYGGYVGNAPRGLYSEAIMIAMKGPRLDGIHTLAAPYEEGPKDSIRWLPTYTTTKVIHFNLIPDWWV